MPLAHEPAHDLDANTTQRLIADIEELREQLGIAAWVLNGVSWGSTLALAYAQAYPSRVLGVVLMAVTTTSPAEVDWITEGVGMIYPEEWDRFAAHAEQADPTYRRQDGGLVQAYARLLRDPATREAASHAWARAHVSLAAGGFHRDPRWQDAHFREPFAMLVTHYWAHGGFLDPPLVDKMDRIAHIPAVLIHGRRDVSGPASTAWQVHRRWPASRLIIVEDEGHGGPEMVKEWTRANDALLSEHLSGG